MNLLVIKLYFRRRSAADTCRILLIPVRWISWFQEEEWLLVLWAAAAAGWCRDGDVEAHQQWDGPPQRRKGRDGPRWWRTGQEVLQWHHAVCESTHVRSLLRLAPIPLQLSRKCLIRWDKNFEVNITNSQHYQSYQFMWNGSSTPLPFTTISSSTERN